MNYLTTLKKSILGFLTGLSAVIVLGVVQSITNYVPVACSADITMECLPSWLLIAYQAIVPTVCAVLVGLANWLKNRNK